MKKQYKVFIEEINPLGARKNLPDMQSGTFKSKRKAENWLYDLPDLFDGHGGSFSYSIKRVR